MHPDDGTCSDLAFSPDDSPVLEMEEDCSYVRVGTANLSAPLISPDGAGQQLSGGTGAIDGGVAVVVSYDPTGMAGAVWIAERGAAGAAWEQAYVVSPPSDGGGGGGGDQLGWSVSVSGGTVVIGSPGYLGGDVPNIDGSGWDWRGRGRAIIVSKDDAGDSWYEAAILEPSDEGGGSGDFAGFGNSVDVSSCGCLAAVGAWHDRESRGSAYVFAKDGDTGTWAEVQRLAPDDSRRSQSGSYHGNYGHAVALSGDGTRLAVRAPYDSYLGSYDYVDPMRGVTYVYTRGDDGTFGSRRALCTPEGGTADTANYSHHRDVAFLDDFLLVGAPRRGIVYVFRLDVVTGDYVPSGELTPSDGPAEDGAGSDFGILVDGRGGASAMVGDVRGGTSYLFAYDADDGVWKERAKFLDGGVADGGSSSSVLSSYGNSAAEHAPASFVSDGEAYSGAVDFYDLVCEER